MRQVSRLSRAWLKRALDFGFSCTDREVMNEVLFIGIKYQRGSPRALLTPSPYTSYTVRDTPHLTHSAP